MEPTESSLPRMLPALKATVAFDDVPALTAALKRGDEPAFAWLHDQWGRRINRYAFALAAGDDAFAADISQNVWLRVVRHIRILPDEPALWNWIACAARHAAIDLRRQGGRYRSLLAKFAEWWQQPSSATADGLIPALEAALLQLSLDERALIESRYFARDPLAAIASRQSITERAVEGRLARLRQRLRELIAEHLRAQNP